MGTKPETQGGKYVGGLIASRLKFLAMTKADLAHKLGVSPAHVSDMTLGKRHITREMAERLDKAIGIDADEINIALGRMPERREDETLSHYLERVKSVIQIHWGTGHLASTKSV